VTEKTVARGTLSLAAYALFFIFTSYLMHSILGRLLNPDGYGIFGLVFSILVWLEILFGGITGSTVKTVAEYPASIARVKKHSTILLLLVSVIIFAISFAITPLLARLFKEPSLTKYLRIAIIDIPFLAIYRVYISLLNGLRLYERQSIASIAYMAAKLAFIVGFVLLDLSITGALIGNVIASVFGLLAAMMLLRPREKQIAGNNMGIDEGPDIIKLTKLAVPFTIFSILYNSLLNIDLWFVQGLLSNSSITGYYTAALNLSRALFYIFSALSIALFPAITASISREDTARTLDYIERAFRSLLVLLIPISIFVAMTASSLVSFIYSSRYLPSSEPLSILAFAYALFSLVIACLYILLANNEFAAVVSLVISMVVVDVLLCIFLVPRYELSGAALSTLITCSYGLIISMGLIWRSFRVFVNFDCFLRIVACSILSSALLLLPVNGWLLPITYMVAGIFYVFLLWIVKELGPEDLATLKAMLRRSVLAG